MMGDIMQYHALGTGCAVRYGHPARGRMLDKTKAFLMALGLRWDEGVEVTVNLEQDGRVVATGSREGGVLKCLGVDPRYQGESLSATLLAEMVKDALEDGCDHLFAYTKPENRALFGQMGFYEVAATPDVVLLENRRNGVQAFVASLLRPFASEDVGCIVAHCNPFTNGHLHLIEQAASRCNVVHLFILSEDRGGFCAEERMHMAVLGTSHLKNVLVHPTGQYMVSAATFPDGFLKERARHQEIHCALDLELFVRHFVPALHIRRRFVGSEPDCAATRFYNERMRQILPRHGIEVVEIPRLESGGRVVSAGCVRELFYQNRLHEIEALVPPSILQVLERMSAEEEAL